MGRVTRVAEFGAFVELEPGVEALAHQSTFAPTGRPGGWSTSVTPGMAGAFEILSLDLEKKRIGVALVLKGETPEAGVAPSPAGIVPGARLKGKVERHERFGVFVFLGPGRTGLIPMSETGVASDAEVRSSVSRRSRGGSGGPRGRRGRSPNSSQREGRAGRARGRGDARVQRASGPGTERRDSERWRTSSVAP